MATIIGDLAVRVGADTAGLTQGMAKANKQVRQLKDEAVTGTKQFARYAAGAAAAGSALAVGLVVRSVEANRELANLSKLANSSVSTFQKMTFGAKSVGVENQKLADILKDTSDRVGDFLSTGGGPMADFFENIAPKVGVTAEQFRNLSGPQALQLYVDSLEKANLSQNEMTFYMEAIASDATALLPLLRENGRAMAEQAAQAERLGLVLSDMESAQIEQAAVAFERVTDVLGSFVDQFTAELAPVITALSKQFLEAAEEAGGVGVAASDAFGFVVKATGFVLDAVEGVKRAFLLAGKAAAAFGLGAVEIMLRVANAVVNKPIQAINELIEKINTFAGTEFEPIGITNLGKKIQSELATVIDAQGLAVDDMHDLLMQPLPSVQFEEYVKQAKQASETVAREMARTNQSVLGGGGEGGQNKTAEDERAKLQEKLARIQQGHMSELELLREKFAEENAIINEAKEQGLINERQRQEIMLANLEQFENQQTAIEKQAADERNRIAEAEQRAKLQGFSDMFGNLSALMNTESRKMFEIGKAAALAGAIVDGYAAITGAYKVGASIGGPPVGAAFAAAAGAATFAQIQNIRNASFNGSAGASAAGAAGSVTGGINRQGEGIQGQNSNGAPTLRVQGLDKNALFSGEQVVELINEARRNGAVLEAVD